MAQDRSSFSLRRFFIVQHPIEAAKRTAVKHCLRVPKLEPAMIVFAPSPSGALGPPMRDQVNLPVLADDALIRRIAHVWIALAAAFCVFDLWRKTGVGLTDGDG